MQAMGVILKAIKFGKGRASGHGLHLYGSINLDWTRSKFKKVYTLMSMKGLMYSLNRKGF